MISKQKIKLIHSLEVKKFRDQNCLFVAEGPKVIGELIPRFKCNYIAGTAEWLEQNKHITAKAEEVNEITQEELTKASLLKHPQKVIALFQKNETIPLSYKILENELCLALDYIQDPGNLGTIIRIANWFGIKNIICSNSTADAYSPKVVQATMGALSDVNLYYTNLESYIKNIPGNIPIYGTFLEGQNIYKTELTNHGLIIMGNEGNGISKQIASLVTRKLYIPPYPANASTVESLNVSVATAITCAEFRRRKNNSN